MDIITIFRQHNRPWSGREIMSILILYFACIAVLLWMRKNKQVKTGQMIIILMEIFYLVVIFQSTVFTRQPSVRTYELQLFWSWNYIWKYHSRELLMDNILNIILFVPFGVLLPGVFTTKVTCKKGLLYGFLISLSIEVLQLVLCRGLFEWDDMIHNSLGAMLGCIMMNKTMIFVKACNRKK